MGKETQSKLLPLLEIAGIFVLPVVLLLFHIIPLTLVGWLFGLASLLILIIVVKERWPLSKLGITAQNLPGATLASYRFP